MHLFTGLCLALLEISGTDIDCKFTKVRDRNVVMVAFCKALRGLSDMKRYPHAFMLGMLYARDIDEA